jgi:hypothetical protein
MATICSSFPCKKRSQREQDFMVCVSKDIISSASSTPGAPSASKKDHVQSLPAPVPILRSEMTFDNSIAIRCTQGEYSACCKHCEYVNPNEMETRWHVFFSHMIDRRSRKLIHWDGPKFKSDLFKDGSHSGLQLHVRGITDTQRGTDSCIMQFKQGSYYWECKECDYYSDRYYHSCMHYERIHVNNGTPMVCKRKHVDESPVVKPVKRKGSRAIGSIQRSSARNEKRVCIKKDGVLHSGTPEKIEGKFVEGGVPCFNAPPMGCSDAPAADGTRRGDHINGREFKRGCSGLGLLNIRIRALQEADAQGYSCKPSAASVSNPSMVFFPFEEGSNEGLKRWNEYIKEVLDRERRIKLGRQVMGTGMVAENSPVKKAVSALQEFKGDARDFSHVLRVPEMEAKPGVCTPDELEIDPVVVSIPVTHANQSLSDTRRGDWEDCIDWGDFSVMPSTLSPQPQGSDGMAGWWEDYERTFGTHHNDLTGSYGDGPRGAGAPLIGGSWNPVACPMEWD